MSKRTSTGFDKTHYGTKASTSSNKSTVGTVELHRAKGVEGQKCNVTACRSPAAANFYNFSTCKFYCTECAFEINRVNRDYQQEYQFPLLCKVPQANEGAEHVEWENYGLIRSTGGKELFTKELDLAYNVKEIEEVCKNTLEKVNAKDSSIRYAHTKLHVPVTHITNATNNIFVGIGRGNHAQRDVSWTAIEVLFVAGYDNHLVLEIQNPEHPHRFEHFALTPGVVYEFNATTKHRFLTKYPNSIWSIATCYVNNSQAAIV